jgi:DNA (cytosine-5)-methyltransferase 1
MGEHRAREANRNQLRLFAKPTKKPAAERRASRKLQIAGLFAGIGGVELGMRRAGHSTTLLCEIEPGARAVLDSRFPEVPKHDDVCTLARLPEGTQLITAGFPCQDLSQAGKTRGIKGARSGLVGEVFRLIESQRVPWVVLENVPFMLQLARGEALEVIVAALEHLGYKWAYRVVDSRAFGLPQRRERVIFVASLDEDPRDVLLADDAGELVDTRSFTEVPCGFYWTEGIRGLGWAVDSVPTLKGGSTIGIASPPAILFPDGMIGTPDIRDAERMQGFDPDWTAPALSVARKGHRWKLVGNAVTVDVFEWLGRRLAKPGRFAEPAETEVIRRGRSWPRVGWNVGNGRFTGDTSSWPVQRKRTSLAEFLDHPVVPLSWKATAGFLTRARRGTLRFPPGFLDAVAAHLSLMEHSRAAA